MQITEAQEAWLKRILKAVKHLPSEDVIPLVHVLCRDNPQWTLTTPLMKWATKNARAVHVYMSKIK